MWNFIIGIHYATFHGPADKYFHLASWSRGLVEKLHDFRETCQRDATLAGVLGTGLGLTGVPGEKSELQVHNKDESKPSGAVTPASVKGVSSF